MKKIGRFERWVRIFLIFLLGVAAGYAWKTYHVVKDYEREEVNEDGNHQRNYRFDSYLYPRVGRQFSDWIYL